MVKWKKKEYGIKFTLVCPLNREEMLNCFEEIKPYVLNFPGDFAVFVDIRNCDIIPTDCKPIIEDVQLFCHANGMKRSVLILKDDLATMQLQLIAQKTGIRNWERYIVATRYSDWKRSALDWIINGVEPIEGLQTAKIKIN